MTKATKMRHETCALEYVFTHLKRTERYEAESINLSIKESQIMWLRKDKYWLVMGGLKLNLKDLLGMHIIGNISELEPGKWETEH